MHKSQISRSFETFAVKPFIHPCQHHTPRGRRSRPVQRGATERRACNERLYLAAIIRLRLRRAERLACYIDLNPVRGALTGDPKDYRFSSYGAAVRGDKQAREALMGLLGVSDWEEASRLCRQLLYRTAGRAGSSGKVVLGEKEIMEVIKEGGRLSFGQIWGQTRYLSDRKQGDRHGMWPGSMPVGWSSRTYRAPQYGDRHDILCLCSRPNKGTDTMCIGAGPR